MGYADRDDEAAKSSPDSPVLGALEVLVRGCGVLLIGSGLALGIFSLYQTWSLYERPERVERFAAAVERGSNIDRFLSPTRPAAPRGPAGTPDAGSVTGEDEVLRLSYLFAWFVAAGLLLVAGTLSFWAVGAGAALARGRAVPARGGG